MKQVLFDIVMKSHFWNMIFTAQKRQKLVTEMYHKSYSSPEQQWRSNWQKLALFFSFTNLCFTVDWCARIRLNVCISLLEKESSGLSIGMPFLWESHGKHPSCSCRNENVATRIAASILAHEKVWRVTSLALSGWKIWPEKCRPTTSQLDCSKSFHILLKMGFKILRRWIAFERCQAKHPWVQIFASLFMVNYEKSPLCKVLCIWEEVFVWVIFLRMKCPRLQNCPHQCNAGIWQKQYCPGLHLPQL